ncbi:MAG TPA: hypothetical protein VFU46_14535 [Gemmatimonadales bacterium]|nr:hypothetical protein [Gemmatimonadales bacterium]
MRTTATFGPVLLALGVAIGACSDATGPEPRQPGQLNIVRLASTAPPLLANSVTFTACRGSGVEGRLFYDNGSGGEGEEFAKLKIDSNTLLRRPDGTLFGPDECVDITMSVPDPTKLEIELQPAGLVFNAAKPAELKIEYAEAEGITDDIEAQLAIWRQESPGQPYTRLGTLILDDLDEAEAELLGFSRYALSY